MILSLGVIFLIGIVAYVWASRGFFSSLVHMVCVLVAGAVAFGLWEPIAYAVLRTEPGGWVVDLIWGASLAIPFAAVLAGLRMGIDSLLPANTDLDSVTNLVGGGACGAVSGTISVGILIISVSFLRLPTALLGYAPISFDSGGSVYREDSLLFPADRITAGLYSIMSRTTLKTGTPMDLWRPNLADEGYLLRTNFNEGGAKHALTPKSFEVLGRYTVGENTAVALRDLTTDSFPPDRVQSVKMTDGEPVPASSYIEGLVVQFKAGAREKEGRVVIGNAQVRLVCSPAADPYGESIAVHPFAMISQAGGDKLDLGRWRFERPKVYIASVGGAAESTMAFEFLVPKEYRPLALYVKGVRYNLLSTQAFQQFPDTRGRDSAIRQGTLLSALIGGTAPLDVARVTTIDPVNPPPNGIEQEVITIGALGGQLILNKDNIPGMQLDENNRIISADTKYRVSDLTGNRGLNRSLQVREFAATDDTRVVQLRVGGNSRIGLLTAAALNADPNQAPTLVDENGTRYVAIGYVYQDAAEVHIRLSPGRPMRAVTELPNGGPTPSRPDQRFYLVFRVSQGVKLKYFTVGDTAIGEFEPALEIIKQ